MVGPISVVAVDSAGAVSGASPIRGLRLGSTRFAAWFGQPNLAGHSIAVLGIAAIALSRSNWVAVLTSLLAVAGVLLSGSRAAWMGVSVGIPLMLWFRNRPRARKLSAFRGLVLVIVFAAAVYFFARSAQLRVFALNDINNISRPEIWAVALRALWAHPMLGLGDSPHAFQAFWQLTASSPQASNLPTMAHNMWLAMGAQYGIGGLLVALWLTAGFAVVAWRIVRWRGLALVATVLLMNFFDFTFFFGWVMVPLVLTVNAANHD